MVQVDALRMQMLLAAESKQLRTELAAPGGCPVDSCEAHMGWIRFAQVLQQPRGMSQNYHQKIVEIVRDTGRKTADTLELLSLPDLLFERALMRDVATHCGHSRRL